MDCTCGSDGRYDKCFSILAEMDDKNCGKTEIVLKKINIGYMVQALVLILLNVHTVFYGAVN